MKLNILDIVKFKLVSAFIRTTQDTFRTIDSIPNQIDVSYLLMIAIKYQISHQLLLLHLNLEFVGLDFNFDQFLVLLMLHWESAPHFEYQCLIHQQLLWSHLTTNLQCPPPLTQLPQLTLFQVVALPNTHLPLDLGPNLKPNQIQIGSAQVVRPLEHSH